MLFGFSRVWKLKNKIFLHETIKFTINNLEYIAASDMFFG